MVVETKTVVSDVVRISTHAGLLDLHVTISSILSGRVSWFADAVELMVCHIAVGVLSAGVGFAGDHVLAESSGGVVRADTIEVLPWELGVWHTLSTVAESWLTANVTLGRDCSGELSGVRVSSANLVQEITDCAFVSNRLVQRCQVLLVFRFLVVTDHGKKSLL